MLLITILSYFLINSVVSKTNEDLNINVEYGGNETIILFYNLTTNYSYFITFRSFGNEQLKFGLFPSTTKSEEHSIEILQQNFTSELFYLFIICFHFIRPSSDLDIQCKDLRLLKSNVSQVEPEDDFLPSYNPLFVPMMYALSVVMLLPVIIQHHRRKKALEVQRRKELRRLSVSITQDEQNPKRNFVQKLLSQIVENGNISYENIPINLELLSVPSTKTILDDLDENPNVTFTIDNLQSFKHQYNDIDEEIEVDAHDCIAHLLDNTPWNTPYSDQPLSTSLSQHFVVRDCATAIKEQNVPTIISLHDDDDDDRKPILKTKKYPPLTRSRTNRAFLESDV